MSRSLLFHCMLGLVSLLMPTTSLAGIIHIYDFATDLSDQLGGPNIIGLGGTVQNGSYNFAANQGLKLVGGLPSPSNYTFVIDFRIDDLNGWRKIVDFKNLTSDEGFYVKAAGQLRWYGGGSEGPLNAIQPNTTVRVALTRDSSSGQVAAYVNGVQHFTEIDINSVGILSPENTIHFLRDDGVEATSGAIDYLAIYDSALSASEVQALGGPTINAVPEPGSIVLGSLVLTAVALHRRYRKQTENQ